MFCYFYSAPFPVLMEVFHLSAQVYRFLVLLEES
jgi:hypothetical protein